MSTYHDAQSQPPLITPPPENMAFDEEVPDVECGPRRPTSCAVTQMEAQRNYVHSPGVTVPILTENIHLQQPCVVNHPHPQYILFPWHVNQVYTAHPTFDHPSQQIHHNPMSWSPTNVHVVPVSLPALSSTNVARETLAGDVTLTSCSIHDSGPYGVWGSNRVVPGSPWSLYPNASDVHSLRCPIEQYTHDPGNHPDLLSACPSLSHVPYLNPLNNVNVTDSSVPYPLSLHHSSDPSLPHWSPRPTSTEHVDPDLRFRLVPPQDSTVPSHQRRGARAIEYGGLWIDEEELLDSLTEPNGELSVHQCLWEEDHSPCHLWIKGDKSSINVHIQKWHRGRPGGDKLEVDCRWSSCGNMMLKESIVRHILSIHLGEMWECRGCGKRATRKDAYGRHIVTSDVDECQTAGALITYSTDVRVIDARAALDCGGSLRYADS